MLLLSRTNGEILDFYNTSTKEHIRSIEFKLPEDESYRYRDTADIDGNDQSGENVVIETGEWMDLFDNCRMRCKPVTDSHLRRISICMQLPKTVVVIRREVLQETGLDKWMERRT